MIELAARMSRFEESASARASKIARDLKAQGRDILALTTGEPDFPTPEHVKQAAIEAMRREETKYTNVDGTPALKRAIAAKFKRENGLDYKTDQIIVGAGAKQAIFNAMTATLEAGDEVIVPRPYYLAYFDIARLSGAEPVPAATSAEDGFKLRPETLEAVITPRTRWLILNSPSNPSGAVYSRAELRALGDVLLRHPGVAVLCDDIYEHILFDGREYCTFAQAVPEMYDRTLTVNGVSKAYAMTGWRIGYAGGPQHLIKAMAKVQSQCTHASSSVGQAAALAALEGPQELVRERSDLFQRRRDFVVEALNKASGMQCPVPEGAFYVFPSCKGALGKRTPAGETLDNDVDFANYLLETEGVAVMNGTAYGMPGHLRLSIASSVEVLGEACIRIQRACAALR